MSAGAERLREAAEVLRDAARIAHRGTWEVYAVAHSPIGGIEVASVAHHAEGGLVQHVSPTRAADAEWIALADPVFGLAVAGWLDATASVADGYSRYETVEKPYLHALAVADAVLGDGEGR